MASDPHSQGQIQEFLIVLRRRRWQIFLPALFVLTLGSVFAVLVPKKYVLTTEIEVREGPRMGPGSAGPREWTSMREIENAKEQVRNFTRLRAILDQQGELWDDYVKLDDREKTEYVLKLRERLEITTINPASKEGSKFVHVSYKDVDGGRGEVFLAKLVEEWITAIVERDAIELNVEIQHLQNETQAAEKAYEDVSEQVTTLAQTMGVDPQRSSYDQRDRGGGDFLIAMKNGLEARAGEVDDMIMAAQAAYDQARRAFDTAESTVPQQITDEGQDFQAEILQLRGQILSLRALRERIKPNHSQWKALGEKISTVQNQIQGLEDLQTEPGIMITEIPNPQLIPLGDAKAAAELELAKLEGERRGINARLTKLAPQVENRISNIEELERLRQEKALAMDLWKEQKSQRSHKEIALKQLQSTYSKVENRPYEVLKAATAKNEPETPNPWLIVIASAMAGLALGGALALAAEYARNSYRSVGDVAAVMAVPVLGAINTIVTTAEARRNQARRAFVGLSSAVICGGLAWFTWVWVYSPERLPTELRQAIDDFRRLLM